MEKPDDPRNDPDGSSRPPIRFDPDECGWPNGEMVIPSSTDLVFLTSACYAALC